MMSSTAHSLTPYSACKPSGIDWLGDVPPHWEVRRLRTVAEMRVSNVDKHSNEIEFPVRLCNYVDVYKNDRITESMPFMGATASWDEIKRFRLEPGDVLITKDSEAWDDIGVPSLVVDSADDLISGYHLALLRPFEEVLGAYLARVLQSRVVAYQFHVRANGVTRYGLTHAAIQSVQIPLPPLLEQRAIVRYLDYVDRRIQRYVAAKRKLIALREEEKQAVVNRAVTRGLDPNVRLKSSGVDWLGDVPDHWEVRRLSQVSGILRGKFTHRPRNDPSLYDGPYPFIQTGDISGANRRIVGYKQTLNEQGLAVSTMFRRGTLVMTIAANIGDVAILDFDACFPDSVVGFAPTEIAHRDYLYHMLLAMKREFVREAPVNTQGNLNIDRIGSMTVTLPPLPEQSAITKYLDEAITDIDGEIARAGRQIELLDEYRNRLIADVVTGKLDVRGMAAQLPDEDSDRPIDENSLELDSEDDGLVDLGHERDEELAEESEVTA